VGAVGFHPLPEFVSGNHTCCASAQPGWKPPRRKVSVAAGAQSQGRARADAAPSSLIAAKSIETKSVRAPVSIALVADVQDMLRKLESKVSYAHHVELLTLTLKINGVTPADLPETLQAAIQAATLDGVVAQHSMIEPGCVLLTMDLLMELDMQRPPLTAEGVARQLHTGPAAAFFRKHKHCIRMHEQVVEGNGQHHLPVQQPSTASDWGGERQFLAAAVTCCVAPSPTGAGVTILLRGHLSPGTTVTARGGGGKLSTTVGAPVLWGHGGLSHMPVSVQLNGLTRGLVYLEVETPAVGGAVGASSATLRSIVPVLVADDAAVRREVNRVRAAELDDDDSGEEVRATHPRRVF
jgi:hypothetical protein